MFNKFHKVENGQIVATINRGGTHNNVSYGKRMPDEEYQNLGWYGEVYETPVMTKYQTMGSEKLTIEEGNKTVIKTFKVIDLPQEETALMVQNDISNAIQSMIDNKAKEFRYDDINSTAKYLRPSSQFYNEVVALNDWCDACWIKAEEIEKDVVAGARTMPTAEEVLAEMPIYTI